MINEKQRLIGYLSSTPASPVLSAFRESHIPICTNNSIIQPSSVNKAHGILCIVSVEILHKAEATGGFLVSIETHHNPFNIAGEGKDCMDLFFAGEKG